MEQIASNERRETHKLYTINDYENLIIIKILCIGMKLSEFIVNLLHFSVDKAISKV